MAESDNPASAELQLFRRRSNEDSRILKGFSKEDQQTIKHRQRLLSSITYFIGKDFSIPVELNEPGAGWHWDTQANKVRVDPKDILEKPLDYLRFVFAHEGSHRRISRFDSSVFSLWQEYGFSAMVNSLEDARVNNFLMDAYPKTRDQAKVAYDLQASTEAEDKAKIKDRLGFQPRVIGASFEYLKQWYREIQGKPVEYSADLDPEVRDIVEKTLASAQDVWWHYPSKSEANQGEGIIKKYMELVQKTQIENIWPLLKELGKKDLRDQRIQELLQYMIGLGSNQEVDIPQDLKDKLNEEEIEQIQQSTKKSIEEKKAVDLDKLTNDLKQKLDEFIQSIPKPAQEDLEEAAKKALEEIEEILNKILQGKLVKNPHLPEGEEEERKVDEKKAEPVEAEPSQNKSEYEKSEDFKKFQEELKQLMEKQMNAFEENRKIVLPVIDALEQDLREIFVARRANIWHSGFKTGKRIDIKKRMQEKARDVSVVESKAWQKRELPQEKDYAITLLVDLSGSMGAHGRIEETFKGTVALTEVLNRLSIKTEIVGFNAGFHVYQPYGEDMSNNIRQNMGRMLVEVHSEEAGNTDVGWALSEASGRLAKQKASEKFIFVLTDGRPEPIPEHSGPEYELRSVVERIMKNTDQKIVGLGLGDGITLVGIYYPHSIDNIKVEDLPNKMADVVKEAISNPGAY